MKHWSLSLALLGPIAQASFDPKKFNGLDDPAHYRNFYDATNYCDATPGPCFTNFKYCFDYNTPWGPGCRGGEQRDPMAWAQLGGDDSIGWAVVSYSEAASSPSPVFPSIDSRDSTFTLKWIHANLRYPTTIALVPGDGSPFYLSIEIPAGQIEYNFTFADMQHDMTMKSTSGSSVCLDAFASAIHSIPFVFSIAQPKDPKFIKEGKTDEFRGNYSDSTSGFYFGNGLITGYLYSQRTGRDYIAGQDNRYRQMQWNWKIGVAVGVSAGVPILLAIAFFLGKAAGEKKVEKKTKLEMWEKGNALAANGTGNTVGGEVVTGSQQTRQVVNNPVVANVGEEVPRDQATSDNTVVDKGTTVDKGKGIEREKAVDKGKGVDRGDVQPTTDGQALTIGQAQ